jgi:hypothetical protein
MNVFLQFIFDIESINKHVRDDWITEYDYTYVDDKIIAGLQDNLSSVADIIVQVEKKATGKTTATSVLSQTLTTTEKCNFNNIYFNKWIK